MVAVGLGTGELAAPGAAVLLAPYHHQPPVLARDSIVSFRCELREKGVATGLVMGLPPSAHCHSLSCVCSSTLLADQGCVPCKCSIVGAGRSQELLFNCSKMIPKVAAQFGTAELIAPGLAPCLHLHHGPPLTPSGANGIVVWIMSMLLSCCKQLLFISRAPRRFKESLNGLADAGWSVIESDRVDSDCISVNPSLTLSKVINCMQLASSSVLYAKESMLLQVQALRNAAQMQPLQFTINLVA